MNLNELLPIAVFSIPAFALLVLIAGAVFFLLLRSEARKIASQTHENAEALERITRAVSVLEEFSLKGFDTRIADLESRKPITVPEPSSPAFVGASRRGQVLRLHRSGESPVNIAETLGVSQGEVDLTLKLQEIFSQKVS